MTEGNWCTSFSGTPLKSYTTEVHPEVCAYTASGGFPDGAVVKNPPAFAEDAEDTSLIPGSGRFPWKRVWQATPVFLPGKFHGQRGQAGYSPQSCKVLDTTEHTHTHTLLQSFSSVVNSNYSDNWLDYAHIVVCIPFSASVPPSFTSISYIFQTITCTWILVLPSASNRIQPR